LPASDESDELSFDDAPAFDKVPSLDDEGSSDAVIAFDDLADEPEIAFDEIDSVDEAVPLDAETVAELPTTPSGPREKVELPAVFEEAAPLEFEDEPTETAPTAEAMPPAEKPKRGWWPFGRSKEKKGKKEKPAKAPRASKRDKTKPAPAEPAEEIEFVLDEAEPLTLEDEAASGVMEPGATEGGAPPAFAPHDPLDDIEFPLDDGGQPIGPLEAQESDVSSISADIRETTTDAIDFADEEIEFDEPEAASNTTEMAATGASSTDSDELAAFSLDEAGDEPVMEFDEAEPAIEFDDVSPADEAEPATDVVALDDATDVADDAAPVFEDPPPAAKERPAKKSRAKDKPAKKKKAKKEKPPAGDKPRRGWWPFGGKKKSAEKPSAAWRGDKKDADNDASLDFGEATIGAGDDLRATLRPDDEPIVFDDSPSVEDEADAPVFDEAEFAEAAVDEAPAAADDAPVFEMDDEEVPAFDLEEEVPEFDEDETAPSMHERHAGGAEAEASSSGWDSGGEPRTDERPPQREPAADNEDDWDNFLKSFDQ